MSYLITGGCGFVGCNIAAHLLKAGASVTVFDNLSRTGASENLAWLRGQGDVRFVYGDSRNANDLAQLFKATPPDVIFHLAGQVAMTTSMQDPRKDFEINTLGSINLLESVRQHCPATTIVYSSSNKVYGELATVRLREDELRYVAPDHPNGLDETLGLDFHTPYGCSKGAADQYMLDYARCYGLNTVVFRHSTIYGGRQFSTYDQGWVGWFCRQALDALASPERAPFTISGNGKQVRDLLYVDDAIACYLAAANRIARARGQAFNIGGGIGNSCSLLELFGILESELGVKLHYQQLPWRHSDQKLFVADTSKAERVLGWRPKVTRIEGIRRMLSWTRAQSDPGST
jgi:CDP-paratose 2-epimerase